MRLYRQLKYLPTGRNWASDTHLSTNAPSVLMTVCNAILLQKGSANDREQIKPALVIGMPIGFSHAPAAERRLMAAGVQYKTRLSLSSQAERGILISIENDTRSLSLFFQWELTSIEPKFRSPEPIDL